MFSFTATESLRGRIHLKAPDTDWSSSMSLEAVGSITEITMQSTASYERCTALGMQVDTGTGKVCDASD